MKSELKKLRVVNAEPRARQLDTLGSTLGDLADTMNAVNKLDRQIDPSNVTHMSGGRMLRLNVLRTMQLRAPVLFKTLSVNLPGNRLTESSPSLSERLSSRPLEESNDSVKQA